MPKKKKKYKVKKKSKKISKRKKKVSKKKRKKSFNLKNKVYKKIDKSNSPTELIIKTKPEWVKTSLANKSNYQKKYSESIKNNNDFWKKRKKNILD